MKNIYKRGKLCYTKTEPKDTENREVLPMRFTETIRKIDVHAHATVFHDYYPPHKNGYVFVSPEEVLAMYDQIGIEKGVLLPLAACEAQMAPMTSEACKYLTTLHPDRFVWFCGVDARSLDNSPHADLGYLLEHYKSLGACGVGEVTTQLYADDPYMDNFFACCAEHEMPVLIHIAPQFGGGYGIVDELGLYRIEKMLKKHPKLQLIGHSQPFWSEISADVTDETRGQYPDTKVIPGRLVELLRNYDNLYCDLSAGSGANAVMRDPEFTAQFFAEFADRILYGCDLCHPHNRHPYILNDFLNQMADDGMIDEPTYRKIVRDNAIRLLKL